MRHGRALDWTRLDGRLERLCLCIEEPGTHLARGEAHLTGRRDFSPRSEGRGERRDRAVVGRKINLLRVLVKLARNDRHKVVARERLLCVHYEEMTSE